MLFSVLGINPKAQGTQKFLTCVLERISSCGFGRILQQVWISERERLIKISLDYFEETLEAVGSGESPGSLLCMWPWQFQSQFNSE